MSEYKKIKGVLHVKHGLFGKWKPLMEHMKKKHPKAYKEIKRKNKK